MELQTVIAHLEEIAPPVYQEDYDNAGLIVGSPSMEVRGVLVCLDSTEAVIEEAERRGCNLVVAHHPIIFKGLKKLTGSNYVERTVIKAIRAGIAIYAIHTNLDNVYYRGVNAKIAERLGLQSTRLLAPKSTMRKLYTFVPALLRQQVEEALQAAGADEVACINQYSLSTQLDRKTNGLGVEHVRLEALFPADKQGRMINALRNSQPNSQVPYDIVNSEKASEWVGSGMIGELAEPLAEMDFLRYLKEAMHTSCVRYTPLPGKKVKRVAVCGGAGGFLLSRAIREGADAFVTADYKYHEFFNADGHLIIADIGHYESEQFTIELLQEIISQKFSTFATYSTEVRTNPVHYLT